MLDTDMMICILQWAFPFNEPVDLERYPDYLKAVSEPMDFGTIKAKIDAGTYVQPGQFNADMRLVFGNAHKYNAPGSDVHHMASTLLVSDQRRDLATSFPCRYGSTNWQGARRKGCRGCITSHSAKALTTTRM